MWVPKEKMVASLGPLQNTQVKSSTFCLLTKLSLVSILLWTTSQRRKWIFGGKVHMYMHNSSEIYDNMHRFHTKNSIWFKLPKQRIILCNKLRGLSNLLNLIRLYHEIMIKASHKCNFQASAIPHLSNCTILLISQTIHFLILNSYKLEVPIHWSS
jgi:hypothetical protein